MTEKQWLASTNPRKMVKSLLGRTSERKYRLFVLASEVPELLEHMWDERSLGAVRAAERFADGLASAEELQAAKVNAWHVFEDARRTTSLLNRSESDRLRVRASWVAGCSAWKSARRAALQCVCPGGANERKRLVNLVRDIFGNPFRPVAVAPGWQAPQVVALAQAAYETRDLPSGNLDLTRLAVLADALEDAGCDDADLLGHLRGPGPHVRGCWAVDLLLGRD